MTTTNTTERYRWIGKTKDGKKKVHGTHFSLSELTNLPTDDIAVAPDQLNRELSLSNRNKDAKTLGGTWYANIGSMAKAQSLVIDGWQKGAERVGAMVAELNEDLSNELPVAIKRERCWSDEGDELDYDKLRNGDVESCWRTSKRRKRAKLTPAVSILVNWGGGADKTSEQLFWAGAAAVALADILENAGYRTAIIAALAARQGGWEDKDARYSLATVDLKDFDEPARVDTLAGTLCHAGVFRTLGFLAISDTTAKVDDSLGSHIEVGELMDHGGIEPVSGTAHVEIPSCYNRESAVEAIRAALALVTDRV